VAAGGEEMNSKWTIVPLGDVLNLAIDSVQVEPNNYYNISGVYSFGRGLLARGPLSGTETTYKVFHRLHENDFVISHLKAWEGALARVTASFDGWFLSPQFSTFQPDPEKLEIVYLEWYCKQSNVWEALRNKARGMGARRDSVLPSQFLALSIPLPPLDEQRRIVARIEELAARIEEARELRRRAVEEIGVLLNSAIRRFIGEEPSDEWIPLSTFIAKIENGWSPSCENHPANDDEWGVLKVGCVSFGSYNHNENKALPPTLDPRPHCEVHPGDFLMSRANTLELVGACAIVYDTRHKLMLSDKIFRFNFKKDAQIDHKYLDYVLKLPALRKQIKKGSTGTSPTMKNISKDKVFNLLILQRICKSKCA
jgi:type I restriction enzyme S subunit